MEEEKTKVLFVCNGNSVKSQIAEGFLRSLYGEKYEAFSAGIEPTRVSPYAVKAMADEGIDLSAHRSKSLDEFREMNIDIVVTLSSDAKRVNDYLLARKHLHAEFDDSYQNQGEKKAIVGGVRRMKNQIKEWIITTFSEGKTKKS